MTVVKKEFKTEVQRLLDLVIHSLYSNRDIFLRELISNASDAIDRARFESLSDKNIVEGDPDFRIKLIVDKDAKTLTISDNGIGMTPDDVVENLGTIASSGTRRFLDQIKEQQGEFRPEMIGQFGVGFYSAFMIADKVTVHTRHAGASADAGTCWESEADGYSMEAIIKEKRGTDVILHLKEEMAEYLEEWKIRKIVKTYSDFIEYPVVMDVERQEKVDAESDETTSVVHEETLNSRKALWHRAKSEISTEEYQQFYKHISHDFQNPLEIMHWNVEGTTEFRALLYLPEKAPFDVFMPEGNVRRGVHLYVKRVFITDNCEAIVPSYLRFLRGVVDSSDLPLNVSRETLQEDRLMRLIQKNVVKKTLDTLTEMQEKQRDRYVTFWKAFGSIVKEGVPGDYGNRDKLQDLLLFESTGTAAGNYTTLKEYVARMPESQKDIYFITGDNRAALEQSPHLEAFRSRNIEVLLMTDPVDEWVVQHLADYDSKELKSIAKGDIELGDDAEKQQRKAKIDEAEKQYKDVVTAVKDALGDKVKAVRLSSRLTDSACCLVSDEHDPGLHMEKIMRAMHQQMPATKRILELNPEHALMKNLAQLLATDASCSRIADYAQLLYDQALLTAGVSIENPLRFTRLVSDLIAGEAASLATATN